MSAGLSSWPVVARGDGFHGFLSRVRIDPRGRSPLSQRPLYHVRLSGQCAAYGSPRAGTRSRVVRIPPGRLATSARFLYMARSSRGAGRPCHLFAGVWAGRPGLSDTTARPGKRQPGIVEADRPVLPVRGAMDRSDRAKASTGMGVHPVTFWSPELSLVRRRGSVQGASVMRPSAEPQRARAGSVCSAVYRSGIIRFPLCCEEVSPPCVDTHCRPVWFCL